MPCTVYRRGIVRNVSVYFICISDQHVTRFTVPAFPRRAVSAISIFFFHRGYASASNEHAAHPLLQTALHTTPIPFCTASSTFILIATMKLVLAAATVGAAQAFVAPSAFSGVSVTNSRVAAVSSTRMSLSEYKDELAATAKAIAGPGK